MLKIRDIKVTKKLKGSFKDENYWEEDCFLREYGKFGLYVALAINIMKKQIAFLRGINVGNIRIKMPDLKLAFETLGFQQVKTYLQTGNVVFESDNTLEEVKPILEKTLSETFNYEAFVQLYDFDFLSNILDKYPFEK